MRVRTLQSLFLTLLTIALAIPTFADDRERHQSYISYDDGGTVVRGADDGRDVEARRNMPVYPGDEIVTARRGRAEVRLADGNIIGIDRTTALKFRSILDSYEGDADETIAELRYGKVAIQRTDLGRQHVRLDTENASYVAEREAIYSVESDSRGRDRVTVFDGSVEVRTPSRSTRLRQGESATVDTEGLYDLVGDQRSAADDFERWFLRRAERFDNWNSRYVDRRLGYWADDLDDHGRWVFVTGIGWSWRPYVAVGWRPYYNGYWHHSRGGCLTWVSYDPWAWGTYHYGRWAFDNGFGWVWVPGGGYSPAWVYWAYGPSYVGWAPSGWWDCYRPYYNWAYQPYRNAYSHYGFGFYGRVRVNEFDLRPWTFVDSAGLISNRIDRAALATDAIKQRLARSHDGYATISGGPARFTREEFRDPAEAIRRRSVGTRDGRNTGGETGASAPDMTPFVRRDPEVGGAIRDRIISRRGGGGGGTDVATGGSNNGPSRTVGGVAPIGGGSAAPIGRGGVAPIGGGSVAPIGGTEGRRSGGTEGRINRGGSSTPRDPVRVIGETPRAETPSDDTSREAAPRSWRDRVGERGGERGSMDRPAAVQPPITSNPTETSTTSPREGRNQSWRTRVRHDGDGDTPRSTGGGSGSTTSTDRGSSSSSGGSSDVPRRVIDRIGGARVVPRDSDSGSSSSGSRDRSSSGGSYTPRERSSGGGGSSTRDSGSSSGSRDRSSGGGNSGGSSTRSSGGGESRRSSGEGGGGRIKRDN